MNLRIAQVTNDAVPNIGGVAAHVHHLSAALVRSGHEVHVLDVESGDRAERTSQELDGVQIHRHLVPRTGSVVTRLRGRHAALASLFARLEASVGTFDLVHSHDYRTHAASIRRLWSGPWVWTNHSSMFVEAARRGRPVEGRLNRLLYRRVDHVIAVSDEIAALTRAAFPGLPVTSIPNGVDTNRFRPDVDGAGMRQRIGAGADATVVVAPRRLVPKNGVHHFVGALDGAARTRDDITLHGVIIGPGPDRSAYAGEVLARARAGAATFTVLDPLPMHEMPAMYAAADIVVVPSLVEAVSLSALEALATGRALVASAVGGLAETLTDGGDALLCPPADEMALRDAVVRLANDPRLRDALATAGLETARRFSWDHVAGRTLAVYERSLADHR